MAYKLAASLICADMLRLEDEIRRLEGGGADFIHFDVMDGSFVPRYGLHPEMLKAIKSISDIPVDVHLMVQNPEPYIPNFILAGADYIVIHAESTPHLHRALKKIKDKGIRAGVALNHTTPLNYLDYILDDIDLVMLMAINPGIVGHKLIPQAMDKIKDLKRKIKHRNILIEIDGGVTFESAPKMVQAGANILVCGSSTIFNQDLPSDSQLRKLKVHLDNSKRKKKAYAHA